MEEQNTDTQANVIDNGIPTHEDRVSAFDGEVLDVFGAEQGSESNNLPVENAFFEAKEETVEEAPQQEQAPPAEETPSQDAKNDQRRYQYWQSQADKTKAEMDELRAEMDALKGEVAELKSLVKSLIEKEDK